MQERVYKTPIHDLTELKNRLVEVWADFEQRIVDKAIDNWRIRLQACVKSKGTTLRTLIVTDIDSY